MLWDCRRCLRQICDSKLMLCLLFNCLRAKNKPKKVAVAVTVLTCVWVVSISYMNHDTDCFEWGFLVVLLKAVLADTGILTLHWQQTCSTSYAVHYSPTSNFSGSVYPEHGQLGRYNWVAVLGSSHELTRRIEKFKVLHTKYDKTGCLLRILITLNRPEPELLTSSLNKLQTRKWCGMQQCGINDFFTDGIFGEAVQLLKEGVMCTLAYGQDQLCGRLFSAAVSCSHMNFICLGLLLFVWLLVSKTGSTWWRVRSLCCLLAFRPRALWQIFKSVGIVFAKVIGEKDLVRALFS